MMRPTFRIHKTPGRFLTIFLLAILVVLTLPSGGGAAAGPIQLAIEKLSSPPTDQIIVKFHPAAGTMDSTTTVARQVDRLSDAAGMRLTFLRPMSGDAYVFRLPARLEMVEVAAIAADLDALAGVMYAYPDAVVRTTDTVPTRPAAKDATPAPRAAGQSPDDPSFADQWHYRYTPGVEEGLNLLPAWEITAGSSDIVVAVIDTGILPHADLAGRTVAGYDFVTSPTVANDNDHQSKNNSRDADPSDPGDWNDVNECQAGGSAHDSSWHGTHVAGTIGAASNNGADVAGVDWNARILPVRVLGRCGGNSSDVIDAIRWAAGLAVPGAPPNPNPARVINMSLGGSGACNSVYQAAIDDAIAAGAVTVVAAGNTMSPADFYTPASCNGVITVAAGTRLGNLAWYSNFGSAVEVTAPGGETFLSEVDGILSTLNDGATGPNADSLAYYQGTSMATPHVAGLAALLFGLDPSLTPAQVSDLIQMTARDFPPGSDCTVVLCGAGLADAYAAVHELKSGLLPPELKTPAGGATLDTPTPLFEWTAVVGAETYGLVIGSDAEFSEGPLDTLVTGVSFTPIDPLPDGTYYWRVNAHAGGEFSLWSEVRMFTIDTTGGECETPAAPDLIAPEDGATTDDATPTLSWNAAANADSYFVYLAEDPDLSNTSEIVTTDLTYTPDTALAPGVYYWAVQGGVNIEGVCDIRGPRSGTRSFTIKEIETIDYPVFLPSVLGQ